MRVDTSAVRRWAGSVFCLLLLASPAAAQFDRGTISGVVKDQSGGVVPGVTVTAKSLQTQELATTVTDASGYFTMTTLRPGRYDVSAELDGFKKASRTGVTLDGGAAISVEFTLEAGNLAETVTVVAQATPIQTDVALRKTVEAKDIELLSFSGRNPIGVPAMKAGVIGSGFNNAGFSSLTNGGFSINGGRADENTISVDGAVAIRTRSAGATIGVQNVDVVQEVQVLTANYLPEYRARKRRADPVHHQEREQPLLGQRIVLLPRRQAAGQYLGAQPQPQCDREQRAGAVRLQAVRLLLRRARPGRDVQEQVLLLRRAGMAELLRGGHQHGRGPDRRDEERRLQPVAGREPLLQHAADHPRPAHGPAVPGQHHPGEPPVTERHRADEALPVADARVPNRDRRTSSSTATTRRTSGRTTSGSTTAWATITRSRTATRSTNWVAIDAFRGTFPFARTDWDRPNKTMNVSWAWTVSNNLINEASYAYSIDQVFINVYTESGLQKRSRTGVNYPYIYPGKEIEDKIPTIGVDQFSTIDGGPYPSSSEGPIHLWTDTVTWVKGRHTMKAGVAVECSGQDDFDQINVNSIPGGTNNQNGQFAFNNSSTARTGLGIADMALGLFNNYAEIGERARTNWRALATDIFFQDSWRPTSQLTIEGGFRYHDLAAVVSTTNNIANFDPRFYSTTNQAVINPATGRLISGPRYNGIVLPGDGFVGEGNDLRVASDPAVQALFRGEPRGFFQTHYDLFEPRLGMSYAWNDQTVLRGSTGIFHNRVTLNDSTLLGGNPPFQPMVTVSGGSADNPGGVAFANNLPYGMQGQDPVFKLPASYMWSAGIQRQLPGKVVLDVNYVGRRGVFLQRERNLNQLQPGTMRPTLVSTSPRSAPTRATARCACSENSGDAKYRSIQISGERRYSNGFKLNVAYTYGKSTDDASDKRNVLWNSSDDANYWGPSSYDRTHALVVWYRCVYDLPFWRDQSTLLHNLLGGWQIWGPRFLQSGTPFSITRTNDIAGVGEGSNGQPVDLVGDRRGLEWGVLGRHRPRRQLRVQPGRLRQPGRGQVRQFDPQHPAEPGGPAVGHCNLQELRPRRDASAPVPRGGVQLHQPPEPQRSER